MKPEKPIILFDSPEAAKPVTMTCWESASGFCFADERTARYDGCTHMVCIECGNLTPKFYTTCNECREKQEVEKYNAREKQEWDGEQMIYCENRDEYFTDPDVAMESWEGDELPRLILCEPTRARALSTCHWEDELPGDEGEAPYWLESMVDEFNKKLETQPILSWGPGKYALKMEGQQ